MNIYAPTAKAPAQVNNDFFNDLQDVVHHVSCQDILLVLGHFNTRVGMSHAADDVWSSVIGSFGLGQHNMAGDHLPMWCATNGLSIMNTFFKNPRGDVVRGWN